MKNKNLLYIALIAVAFLAFRNKKKLSSKVNVRPLENITKEEFETPVTSTDILIQDVKDAIDTTPNPLDIAIKKAKSIINKKKSTSKTFNEVFAAARKAGKDKFMFNGKEYNTKLAPKINMPVIKTPPIKQVKPIRSTKKAPRKRVKGFDNMPVLY